MVFGELVPKMFALKNKEWVVLKLSPLLKMFAYLSSPFIKIIETVVRTILKGVSVKKFGNSTDEKRAHLHDLKSAVTQAKSSRILGGQEERMILAAAQLTTRQVREIVTPASEIYTIHSEASLTDALIQAHMDMHSRFPVCSVKNDPQTIEGYVNFKDIIVAMKMSSGETGLKGIVRPILRVEEKMTISEVLEKMLLEKAHISLVVTEQKTIAGMITLEDVMEQLVGDVGDEYDKPSTKILPYGQSWLMGGAVLMSQVAEKLGLQITETPGIGKNPSLQAWCAAKLGRPAKGGEVIERDHVMVVPRKFRRNQMIESVVSKIK
jgi:putative hemolysin